MWFSISVMTQNGDALDFLGKIEMVSGVTRAKEKVLHAGKLLIRTLLLWVASSVSRVVSDKDLFSYKRLQNLAKYELLTEIDQITIPEFYLWST